MLRFHLIGLSVALLIGTLTLFPGSELPQCYLYANLGFDKLIHLSLFTILSITNLVGFTKQYRYRLMRFNTKLVVAMLCVILAVLTELFQSQIDDRTTQVADLIFNLLGIALGYLLFRLIYGKELWQA